MKKIFVYLRSSVKLISLIAIAMVLIIAAVVFIYKPIYSVSLNGEFIGYSQDKSKLQKKVNDYIKQGDSENVAFVQLDNLPEYKLCLLKKGIVTNDDEIYEKIKSTGVTYYKYYAIALDTEEKLYVQNFTDAEAVVEQLKQKNSSNKDKVNIIEKYETELAEFKTVEDAVSNLYVEPAKKVTVAKTNTVRAGSATNNTSSKVVNIGINFIKPVSGTISSRYGSRWGTTHGGIDIAAPYGTPIKAAADGVVSKAGWNNGGYGYLVVVSHGNGVETYYGHCSSIAVAAGQKVSAGQVLSYVGSTGDSSGNHLHFEVRVNGVRQNPQNYVY